jgi:hypothetical protein
MHDCLVPGGHEGREHDLHDHEYAQGRGGQGIRVLGVRARYGETSYTRPIFSLYSIPVHSNLLYSIWYLSRQKLILLLFLYKKNYKKICILFSIRIFGNVEMPRSHCWHEAFINISGIKFEGDRFHIVLVRTMYRKSVFAILYIRKIGKLFKKYLLWF